MSTITFRVSEEEKSFLEKVSKFENVSLSDFVRQRAISAAEDMMDYQTFLELKAEHDKNDESISHEEMLKELGL